MVKKTAIYDGHKKLGAKIVEFAGFLMPLQYKNGILSDFNLRRERLREAIARLVIE